MRIRLAPHVHSEWSYDGRWPLAELARAFARRGYRAVLMAEHDRGFDAEKWDAYRAACTEASTNDILLIPGIEYSDAENAVHLATWGEIPFLGEGRPTIETLQGVAAAGGISVLAHPWRRGVVHRIDPAWLELLHGYELWNRKYDGWAPRPDTLRVVPPLKALVPFVALDFHTSRQFWPFSMTIDVDGAVKEADVCGALRTRRCQPQLRSIDARRFAEWPGLQFARTAERIRRPLARRLRSVLGR